MCEQNQQKRTNLYFAMIGFGAGTIIGATTALLLAPASGRETSAAIKEKWAGVSDKAGEMYTGAKDALSNVRERTAETVESVKDRFSKHKEAPENEEA